MYFSFLSFWLHYPLVHRSCDHFFMTYIVFIYIYIYIYMMMMYVVFHLSLCVLFLFSLYTHVSLYMQSLFLFHTKMP